MSFLEQLRGFSWGVHPKDHKQPAAEVPLRTLPLPHRLFIPLQQHLGNLARTRVVVGQKVLKGEMIAEAHGAISAAIHAPTSGKIIAVGEIAAPHPSGLSVRAITLEADGEECWAELETVQDPFALDPADINRKVAVAGVVGLGGATFPSAVKLTLGKRSKVHTLIMNGGECEPYLSCDDRIMRERADPIIAGIRIMQYASGANKVLIGIEKNKPDAIAAMQKAAQPFNDIQVCPVPTRYPMGSEKQLILALIGEEVPADGRPGDIGILLHNVSTAYAVYEAIHLGRPLISRMITVNGGLIANPGNLEVPMGALVQDILNFCKTEEPKGEENKKNSLIMGGPMMGLRLPHTRIPVIKGTSGILYLSAKEIGQYQASPCIRCGNCIRACPMGLLPLEMAGHIRVDDLTGAVTLGLKDCIACGCCAYVCQSRIPLVQYFSHAKSELAAQERNKLRQEATKRMAQSRSERIERETREKAEAAARRKAERDAAKAAATKAATETQPSGES